MKSQNLVGDLSESHVTDVSLYLSSEAIAVDNQLAVFSQRYTLCGLCADCEANTHRSQVSRKREQASRSGLNPNCREWRALSRRRRTDNGSSSSVEYGGRLVLITNADTSCIR
jgi:hypothetical protein